MKNRTPEIDAYIANAPEYAQPILTKIRDAFHAGCPTLEERIKWGHVSFEYKGMLGGMAAFKKHVTFGFWKSRLMEDFHELFSGQPRASMLGTRVETVAGLPPKKVLVAYVKAARRVNDAGLKEPKHARPKGTLRVTVPPELKSAFAKNAKAKAAFEALAPSHKKDYVEWITEAKRDETRATRLKTTLQWLAEGKRRNWKYEARAKT